MDQKQNIEQFKGQPRLPKFAIPKSYDLYLRLDLSACTFSGLVNINLSILDSTKYVVLNACELSVHQVLFTNSLNHRFIPCDVVLDADDEILVLVFEQVLGTGEGVLHIEFSGALNEQLKGLYKCSYVDKGVRKSMAVTQFEALHARRCFPCWDEPALKASFKITLDLPSELIALSNMPISDEKINGSVKTVYFEESPKMSSYLIALAVGLFDHIEETTADEAMALPSGHKVLSREGVASDAGINDCFSFRTFFSKKRLVVLIEVFSARGQEAVDTALKADLVLWWFHGMRGHYFKLEYVKHLPFVGGAMTMIDSHITTIYWKNRTKERLGIEMTETYVVHLGNIKELMEVAENKVAKRILPEHVRESLGVRNEDLVFALINSVSRGNGQDLFLRHESLKLIQEKKLQTKFETELRNFVSENNIQGQVHFANKTLTVAPYLASIDVPCSKFSGPGRVFRKDNNRSYGLLASCPRMPCGHCSWWQHEIVVNGTTGLLHRAGKEGVMPLGNNIAN
ncbi:hypothetical protein V6N11_002919 [Hibiscus sabdariffa]|uniref:Aminopeptidase N-like N-terminal domain-containing protein n=1 Tax=Hibiscus sabdariffa TaxID=183260 RepID=A0ABR2SCK9_9ROSI